MISHRVWLGMLIATLAAASITFLASCFYAIVLAYPEIPKISEVTGVFLFIGGISSTVTGIVVFMSLLLFGLPLYLLSIKMRKVTLQLYVKSGFLVSMVFGAVLTDLHLSSKFLMDQDFYFSLICIFITGPAITSVFWFFNRPDRIRPYDESKR